MYPNVGYQRRACDQSTPRNIFKIFHLTHQFQYKNCHRRGWLGIIMFWIALHMNFHGQMSFYSDSQLLTLSRLNILNHTLFYLAHTSLLHSTNRALVLPPPHFYHHFVRINFMNYNILSDRLCENPLYQHVNFGLKFKSHYSTTVFHKVLLPQDRSSDVVGLINSRQSKR